MQPADKVVAYFYDSSSADYSYNWFHPWRPLRSKLVDSIVRGYGLDSQMVVHRPTPRTFEELTEFHADDYISCLRDVNPDNFDEYKLQLRRFNMGSPHESDCPVFDGMYDYFSLLSGGSVEGAAMLAAGKAQVAFNWAGGMHHAKKAEASGFCYVNDIVLAVLELLKTYQRVLYVDIDIHHGDGVEEAFYLTERVMTVSFHRYGDYFPGTGSIGDVGMGSGKHYCVNVPLRDGMDDESYRSVYEPVMTKVMEVYQPEAVIICSGADSLSGDRLGCFNLSLQGHSNCLEFLARYNLPMVVVGGGGYTLRNVARCWAYETGRLMGIDLPDQLPDATLREFDYYMDTHRLRIEVTSMKNQNKREELEGITQAVLANLAQLPPVPSVGIHQAAAPKQPNELPEEDMEARGGGLAYDDARRIKPGDEEEDGLDPEQGTKKSALRQEIAAGGGAQQEQAAAGEAAAPATPAAQPAAPDATRGEAEASGVAAANANGVSAGGKLESTEQLEQDNSGAAQPDGAA